MRRRSKFELITGDGDRRIVAMQAREDLAKRHRAMRWSRLQKMYDITGRMERMPGLSSAAKAVEYESTVWHSAQRPAMPGLSDLRLQSPRLS